jgi:uracil-DNA glycosylase family 4
LSEKRPPLEEVARLLRQRTEIGSDAIYLDGLTRAEALKLAAAARRASKVTSEPTTNHPGASAPVSAAASDVRVSPPPPRTTPSVTADEAVGGLPVLPANYDEVRGQALACTRCRLSDSRTQVVFSDGSPTARLMVVGEAPGANEDQTGVPFVGAAGKFLDMLLSTVDLSREDSVYIANVLKCRPPGNRNPMPDEIEACSPFLKKQIELVQPEALLAVGTFSAQLLTGQAKTALGKIRGEVHSYQGVPLVVTYHPAALLRNPKWTRSFWDDLQMLRTVMDGSHSA